MQSVRVPRAPLVMAGVLVCLLLLAHSNLRAQDAGLAASAITPDAPALAAPANGALTTGVTHPPLGVPTFAWQTVANATKYQLQISVADGFATTVVNVETENTNYTPIIALGSGIFYWRVRAAAGNTWGPYSQVWDFTVDWSAAGILAPQLTAPADGAERAAFNHEDFTWTPVPGAATYSFKIARDPDMASIAYSAVTVAPHHTPLQRLDNNLYYWQVTPIDNRGHAGAASDVQSFTFNWSEPPQALAPDNQAELVFVPRFSWTAIQGAKEYRLQISTQDNFLDKVEYVTRNTDYTPVRALENDRDYFWRVQAVDQRGVLSLWSAARRFRIRWIFQPRLLSPANNSLQLAYPFFSWAPTPGAEHYQIQISANNAFNPKIADATVYNVTNYTQPQWASAAPGSTYYWQVRAIDAQGNVTPWSETWSFQFADPTGSMGAAATATSPNLVYPPPYFVPDTANMPTYSSHSLSWPLFIWDTAHDVIDPAASSPVTPVDLYRLEVDDDQDMSSPAFTIDTAGLAAAPTQDHPFVGLQDDTTYYWRVTALRNNVQVGAHIQWTMHYSSTAAQVPVTVTAVAIYPDDGFEAVGQPPVLGWQPVTGAAHYRVQVARDQDFTATVDEAAAQFINYVPWQGRLDAMPFGAYWWRVRGEDAGNNPVGDWSSPRRFNLSVELAIGNYYDFRPPDDLTTDTSGRTHVANSAGGPGDHHDLRDLYIVADRYLKNPEQHWVIAFTTGAAVEDVTRYALYFDTDHVPGSGGATDPLGNTAIAIDPLYRPEHVIYVNKIEGGQVSATYYRWTGSAWAPGQTLASLGGEVQYLPTQSIQLFVPYTTLGSADSDWVGSLALTVYSLDAAANLLYDSLPEPFAGLPNPAFVSNMLLPLFPFDTPLTNPIIFTDMPPLRWRMPAYGADGYQVQVARDAQFTNIVETWESYETGTISAFTLLPTTFQSLVVWENNESYYWRVRQRHEKYGTSGSDYGPWSPAMRFKLDSQLVGNIRLSTGVDAFMTPTFEWDRMEGAAGYTIQIDDDANFSSPLVNQATDATSYTPPDTGSAALFPGVQYYWRVVMRRSSSVLGHWSAPLTFIKTSLAPLPLAPLPGTTIAGQPTLHWTAILTPAVTPRLAAPVYQVQVANNSAFSQPKINKTTQATSFTPAKGETLADGEWYWRVAFIDANGKIGPYSPSVQFTKKYSATVLLTPPLSQTIVTVPAFAWEAVPGAAAYRLDYATNDSFNSATRITTDMTNTAPSKLMPYSTYHWRVQMLDADGNASGFQQGAFYYYLPASYIASPTTAIAPATVIFTDTSVGNIQARQWFFGDGQSSTAANPSHIYTTAGVYTVTLHNVTTDNYTRTAVVTEAVRIYQRVTAMFNATPTTGPAPLTVQFNNLSTGSINRWLWNFGDGLTSTEISPTHVYTQPGSYQVVLTASGPGGVDVQVRQRYIVVTAPPVGTPTVTPTATPTSASATATSTPSPTSSATRTPIPFTTSTATVTPTSSATRTPTLSNTPTAVATTSATATATPTSSATRTPGITVTPTATATPTPTIVSVTATATSTPSPTVSATPTSVPSSTPTPTVSATATATGAATATVTATDTAIPTDTTTATTTPTATTVMATATATATATPTSPSAPPGPIISGIAPDQQRVGESIIALIAGANFVDGANVHFGETPAQGVTFISSSQLAVLTSSALAPGVWDVRVCNLDIQCHALPAAFSVTSDALLHSLFLPVVQR